MVLTCTFQIGNFSHVTNIPWPYTQRLPKNYYCSLGDIPGTIPLMYGIVSFSCASLSVPCMYGVLVLGDILHGHTGFLPRNEKLL